MASRAMSATEVVPEAIPPEAGDGGAQDGPACLGTLGGQRLVSVRYPLVSSATRNEDLRKSLKYSNL